MLIRKVTCQSTVDLLSPRARVKAPAVPRRRPRQAALYPSSSSIPAMIEFKLAFLTAIMSLFAAAESSGDFITRQEIMVAMLCATGAMGGSFLGLAFAPGKTTRQNIFLVGVNFMAGITISPLVVELVAARTGLRPDLSLCLFIGAVVAALFVLMVKPILPYFSSIAAKLVEKFGFKTSGTPGPGEPPRP